MIDTTSTVIAMAAVVAAFVVGHEVGRHHLLRRLDDRFVDVIGGADHWPVVLKPIAYVALLIRCPLAVSAASWRYLRTGSVWPEHLRRRSAPGISDEWEGADR